ncbi:MAG: stage V sporulation protein AD [Clostridia bacterium]|nr:stage V sporulation protein AD [Clostridia bacterium]
MPERIGARTLRLDAVVTGSAAVGGKTEAEGPLGRQLDAVYPEADAGEKSWEKAESTLHADALTRAIAKAGLTPQQIDLHFGGDLLDQCIGTSFAARPLGMPLVGVYGACSTMALALGLAALAVDAGAAQTAVASTSSHFCAAEKQFRMPLEYGGQRTPTAQWTATAAGAAVVRRQGRGPHVRAVCIGRIRDYGVKDANNMGAAMAPAACDTITAFLRDTGTRPTDYDCILTGDLGAVGSELLLQLAQKEAGLQLAPVHRDCGLLLYDLKKQTKVGAGGSGCGCSAAVLCADILQKLGAGQLARVLFVGTGALLSGVSSLQNETVPAIAHAVLLEKETMV